MTTITSKWKYLTIYFLWDNICVDCVDCVDFVDCVDCVDCIAHRLCLLCWLFWLYWLTVLIKNPKKYLSVCYNFKLRCACTSKNMVCFGLTPAPALSIFNQLYWSFCDMPAAWLLVREQNHAVCRKVLLCERLNYSDNKGVYFWAAPSWAEDWNQFFHCIW